SLLVWTHEMRTVSIAPAFVARGCPDTARRTPAVTVGAGARWLEAYQAVTVHDGRYVQGGGCTSVGAAGGFLQGGGFGSWSKKYGVAAASMLEALEEPERRRTARGLSRWPEGHAWQIVRKSSTSRCRRISGAARADNLPAPARPAQLSS